MAISDYNQAASFDPSNSSIYFNRAWAYVGLNQYDSAISNFGRSIILDPEDAYSYNNRANLYRQVGKFDLARNDVYKSLDLDNNNGWAYATLAMIYADEGSEDQFFKNIEIAIEKPVPYPLCERLEVEKTLQIFKNSTKFRKLLERSH